ncbi:MAG: hypothetical protein ACI4P3_00590, partial [Candidatus Spyradosoma sp.]
MEVGVILNESRILAIKIGTRPRRENGGRRFPPSFSPNKNFGHPIVRRPSPIVARWPKRPRALFSFFPRLTKRGKSTFFLRFNFFHIMAVELKDTLNLPVTDFP